MNNSEELKTMTELWLVRHGETDWNLSGRWQGQAPDAPGLNENGRAQALVICEQIKAKNISAIYSSDLLRARQTAKLMAQPLGLTEILEPRLREMDLGEWEGMLSDEIEEKYPQELAERTRDPFHTPAPNGESPVEVEKRVLSAINEIASKHPNQSVLIVAHGVSLAVILCQTEGFQMEEIYQHVPNNAQPYRVQWRQ